MTATSCMYSMQLHVYSSLLLEVGCSKARMLE
jgi:hypothetical protein